MFGYRKVALLALLFAFCMIAKARAEDSCLDIQRNYDLVKAEAVSVQTNAALFAAADSGCEDLARKTPTRRWAAACGWWQGNFCCHWRRR
jgi:hypothetical protein